MSASAYLEMKLKTDANYQNVIPLDIRYDIEAPYDVSLLTCSFRCLQNHPYCCAILYNEISRSCRVLNSFLDDGLVMTSHGETWTFLTKEQGFKAWQNLSYLKFWINTHTRCGSRIFFSIGGERELILTTPPPYIKIFYLVSTMWIYRQGQKIFPACNRNANLWMETIWKRFLSTSGFL